MDYYFLEYRLAADGARVTADPDAGLVPEDWTTGAALAAPPAAPVGFRILAGDGGRLPDFVDDPIPLMSDALVAALRAAGVDNLELVEAVVEDREQRVVHRGFHAVNVLGLVDCVDDEADTPSPYPVIDGARTHDLALFRPAWHARRIAVHRRVKARLEAQPIGAALDFRSPRASDETASQDADGD